MNDTKPPLTIVIIDDDLFYIRFIEKLLQFDNCRIFPITDPLDALENIKSLQPNCIIVDHDMPGMSGERLIKEIRFSGLTTVPIAMLTASNDDNTIAAALLAGADNYILKSASQRMIHHYIKSLLRLDSLQATLKANLQQKAQLQKKLDNDIRAAQTIQADLIKVQPPRYSGLALEKIFIVCEHLAGDMMGIWEISPSQSLFFIFDISGHGISAAYSAFTLITLLRRYGDIHDPTALALDDLCHQVNNAFIEQVNFLHMATLFVATFDRDTHLLTYCNAGHPPPMIYSTTHNQLPAMDGDDLPLGMFNDLTYQIHTRQLNLHDRILLYTDGIVEAENAAQEHFGYERLQADFCQTASQPLPQALKQIYQHLTSYTHAAPPGVLVSNLFGANDSRPAAITPPFCRFNFPE